MGAPVGHLAESDPHPGSYMRRSIERTMAVAELGSSGQSLLDAVRGGPVEITGADGEVEAIAMSADLFRRMCDTHESLATGLYAGVTDIFRVMGVREHAAQVLGLTPDEWEEVRELRGINPMSAAGARGLEVAEIYRGLVRTVGRDRISAWMLDHNNALGMTPREVFLGQDGARRLRDFVVNADPADL